MQYQFVASLHLAGYVFTFLTQVYRANVNRMLTLAQKHVNNYEFSIIYSQEAAHRGALSIMVHTMLRYLAHRSLMLLQHVAAH